MRKVIETQQKTIYDNEITIALLKVELTNINNSAAKEKALDSKYEEMKLQFDN